MQTPADNLLIIILLPDKNIEKFH